MNGTRARSYLYSGLAASAIETAVTEFWQLGYYSYNSHVKKWTSMADDAKDRVDNFMHF